MKVVKIGQLPKTPWVGVYRCSSCGAEVELSAEDKEIDWAGTRDVMSAKVPCPTCRRDRLMPRVRHSDRG